MPERVQLSRKKGWRMPANTVKVDRSTPWGNPYPVTHFRDAEAAVEAFKGFAVTLLPDLRERARRELHGKNLACWCPLDQPCHADVLLELANSPPAASDAIPLCASAQPARGVEADASMGGRFVTILYHRDLVQGSEEWHQARCGLITASEVKLLLSPKTLKPLNNDKTRAHVWELAAQRISNYVEPSYIGDEMLRGYDDEITARDLYRKHFGEVEEVGFVTNDEWGFTIGCSPDGLVGDDGSIETKSRRQKFQVQTIVEHFRDGTIPEEHVLQVQTILMVTGRDWCDFLSFSGGLPMQPIRVEADTEIQNAIEAACAATEQQIIAAIADYRAATRKGFIQTERRVETEMFV